MLPWGGGICWLVVAEGTSQWNFGFAFFVRVCLFACFCLVDFFGPDDVHNTRLCSMFLGWQATLTGVQVMHAGHTTACVLQVMHAGHTTTGVLQVMHAGHTTAGVLQMHTGHTITGVRVMHAGHTDRCSGDVCRYAGHTDRCSGDVCGSH